MWQNFASIGRRSSEILWRIKKKTSRLKQKALVPGGLMRIHGKRDYLDTWTVVVSLATLECIFQCIRSISRLTAAKTGGKVLSQGILHAASKLSVCWYDILSMQTVAVKTVSIGARERRHEKHHYQWISLSFRLWIPQVRGQPHGFFFSIQLDSRHPPRSAASPPSCAWRRQSISFSVFLCSVVHLRLPFEILLTQSSSSRRCTCPYHLSLASVPYPWYTLLQGCDGCYHFFSCPKVKTKNPW